jgi:NosR/NirI family nitrous oxide reductase transcriptional regulator
MPLLRRVLLILGLGAFLAADVLGIMTRAQPYEPDPDLLRQVCPGAGPLVRQDARAGPCYAEEGPPTGGKGRALAFVTDQVKPKIKGYVDQVSLLVGLDDTGAVTGVRLLDHKETPSYMKSIVSSGFLEKLTGRKLGPELAEVDAVTGATVTSEAIRQDILQGGALLARERFGLELSEVPKPQTFLGSMMDPHSLALTGALALALAAYVARSRRAARALSLAGGFIVLGVYVGLPLSTAHFTSLAALKFPPTSNAPLILLLGFVFLTALVFRTRVYCDYLCPYAAVQEVIYLVTRRRAGISERVWKGCTAIRYFLLFAIAILTAVGGYQAVGAMEPYVFLFNPKADVLPWLYVAAALTAALFMKRFWCRVFCPCGTCIEIIASAGNRLKARGDRPGQAVKAVGRRSADLPQQ